MYSLSMNDPHSNDLIDFHYIGVKILTKQVLT